jgi:hypothetical protein
MPTTEIRPDNRATVIADRSSEGKTEIIPVNAEGMERYAEDLAFLEEEVEVMLQPTLSAGDTARLAGPFLCNGKGIYIPKGEWVKIKRKYLGIILTATTDQWTFTSTPVGNSGAKNHEYAVRAGRYPLAGVRDNNPKGAKWLQALQANPLF